MTPESPRKENWIEPVHARLPRIWHGEVDLVDSEIKSTFLPEHFADDRGLLSFTGRVAKEPDETVEFEYQASGAAMRAIQEAHQLQQARTRSLESEAGRALAPGPHKWSSYGKDVDLIVRTRGLFDITDALGLCRRTKGTLKDEERLRSGLEAYLETLLVELSRKLGARLDGVEFIRHLLRSREEALLETGLELMTRFPSDGLQDELAEIARDPRVGRRHRRLAHGYLSADRRRALVPGRAGRHRPRGKRDPAPPTGGHRLWGWR